MRVTAKNGRNYFFGDALNALIIPEGPGADSGKVWLNSAGTACALGLPETDLPGIDHLFAHVTATIASDKEGFLSTPENHHPQLSA